MNKPHITKIVPIQSIDGASYRVGITCTGCKQVTYLVVNQSDYNKWHDGALIQNAMPYLNADQREMLISGTCPKCWDEMVEAMMQDEAEMEALFD